MNCHHARNRIMAVEEPASLPEELAEHLEGCEPCRAWMRTYEQMNGALNRLAVPAAAGYGKIAVLERIRGVPTIAATPSGNHKPFDAVKPMPIDLDDDLPVKNRRLAPLAAKYWPVGVIAATLLIGVIAWLNLRGQKPQQQTPQPSDPMLDNVVRLNVEFARAQAPADRVEVLTKLADELNQEMRDIARADSTGENMQALEQMYRKVVLQGLIAQAKLVLPAQRAAVLGPIANRLAAAKKVAAESAAASPEHSAVRLRNVADIAGDGAVEIHKLIKEAST